MLIFVKATPHSSIKLLLFLQICVFFYVLIYSSLSSSEVVDNPGLPPAADCDDDDKIGPDNRKTDDKIPPTPADEPLPALGDASSPRSSESLSAVAVLPAPAPKLKPPEPPDDDPLSAPNFVVIAAIFGDITACSRL